MDQRSPRDGKTIEDIGYYDPMIRDKSQRVRLKMDRLEYWLSVGAQPSEKVAVLIKKVRQNKFPQAVVSTEAAATEAAAEAAPASEEQ